MRLVVVYVNVRIGGSVVVWCNVRLYEWNERPRTDTATQSIYPTLDPPPPHTPNTATSSPGRYVTHALPGTQPTFILFLFVASSVVFHQSIHIPSPTLFSLQEDGPPPIHTHTRSITSPNQPSFLSHTHTIYHITITQPSQEDGPYNRYLGFHLLPEKLRSKRATYALRVQPFGHTYVRMHVCAKMCSSVCLSVGLSVSVSVRVCCVTYQCVVISSFFPLHSRTHTRRLQQGPRAHRAPQEPPLHVSMYECRSVCACVRAGKLLKELTYIPMSQYNIRSVVKTFKDDVRIRRTWMDGCVHVCVVYVCMRVLCV